MPQLSRETCAYLAGLFDGEACFAIQYAQRRDGTAKYSARVRIALTHKPTIEWVADVLQRPMLKHGLSRRVAATAKPMYRVGIENIVGIISLLEQLRPFMKTKVEAADVVLAFCRSRQTHLQLAYHQPYTESEIALSHKLRLLNAVGQKGDLS